MQNDRKFVSEEEISRAVDYLRDNAFPAAKARAERLYLEDYTKVLRAQLMREKALLDDKLTLSGQERDAMADQRYMRHLEALKQAIEADERHRFSRDAAMAKLEAWRTQESNHRAILKGA